MFGVPESRPLQHEASDSISLSRINITKLDCFFDRNRKLTNEGNAGAVIYLHPSRAFDTVPHEISLEKLIQISLEMNAVFLIENRLEGYKERLAVSSKEWS